MQFFPLITFQEMALAFFLGLGTFVLLYVAWGSYPRGRADETAEVLNEPEAPGLGHGPKAEDNPIPPFLIFIYVGVTAWVLAYLLFVGLGEKAIG